MNAPKLRFKADDGSEYPEWKTEKIDSLVEDYYEKYDGKENIPVLTSSREGLLPQIKHFNREQVHDITDYNVIPKGYCTYRNRSDDGIFKFNINRDVTRGIVSKFYPVFCCLKNTDTDFLIDYLNNNFNTKKKLSVISVGTSQTVLSNRNFHNLSILCPCLEEQHKIADFFSVLDQIIEKTQKEIDAWEKQKRGVMQVLFSQKLRFKADDGREYPEWEEKRLGDIFKERNERSQGNEELLSVTIGNGVIHQLDTDKRNIAASDTSNYKIVHKGDLAYNTMRMWQGAEGVSEYNGIISPAYTVLICDLDNYAYFYASLFKQEYMLNQFQRHSQGLTSDTWNLKYNHFSEIHVEVPCLQEQQKIADCLSAFDTVIDKSKQELAAYQKLKKGLLQQMFI